MSPRAVVVVGLWGVFATVAAAMPGCRRRRHETATTGHGDLRVVSERLSPEPDDAGLSAASTGTLRYELSVDGALREGETFAIAWSCESCPLPPTHEATIASATVSLTRAMLAARPVIVAGELTRPEAGWVEGTYRVDVSRGAARWRQYRFTVRP